MAEHPEPPPLQPLRSPAARGAMAALGVVFVIVGLIGLLIPVMPTSPFMVLALWAFTRSSRRFQVWLWTHPWFGPPLQRWHRHGVIPLGLELIYVAATTASLAWLTLGLSAPGWVIALAAAVMVPVGVFLFRFPSRVPED